MTIVCSSVSYRMWYHSVPMRYRIIVQTGIGIIVTDGGIRLYMQFIVIDDGGITTRMIPIDEFPVIHLYHDRIVRMPDITTPIDKHILAVLEGDDP